MSDFLPQTRAALRPKQSGPRFRMLRIVVALMLREMATTYGKSAGGYVWAIVEPILGIALLSLIFSLALSSPGIGSNFPLFYASGYLPFAMFNDISKKVAASIKFSKPFLAYPSVTFIDSMIARILLNVLTHIAITGIVLAGIFVVFRIDPMINLGAILQSLLLTALLAAGVGALNCYLCTAFPVWERIWNILTRPLFLMSGIFYAYAMMPPLAQDYLYFNPLIHTVGLMRSGLYPTYDDSYLFPEFVAAVGLICLLLGLALLERSYRKLLER